TRLLHPLEHRGTPRLRLEKEHRGLALRPHGRFRVRRSGAREARTALTGHCFSDSRTSSPTPTGVGEVVSGGKNNTKGIFHPNRHIRPMRIIRVCPVISFH